MYCQQCRKIILAAENAAVSKQNRYEQELLSRTFQFDEGKRENWDVMILDEYGREVWAKDLAKRYRKELNARRNRDYRHRD
jgi:hypothetical protein